jgi:hypothetical protein
MAGTRTACAPAPLQNASAPGCLPLDDLVQFGAGLVEHSALDAVALIFTTSRGTLFLIVSHFCARRAQK